MDIRPQGLLGRLQERRIISPEKIMLQQLLLLSSDKTHLGDPFFAPLADSFADTDYTFYSSS